MLAVYQNPPPQSLAQNPIFNMSWDSLYVSHYRSTATMAIISTVLYGFNVAVAIGCIKSMTNQKEFSSRRRYFLTSLYIAMMVGFASQAVVSTNTRLTDGVVDSFVNPTTLDDFVVATFSPPMPITLPLAVWGADALLIYRCTILYRLISRSRRIALYAFLTLATLASLGSGIAAYCLGTIGSYPSRGFAQLVGSGITPSTIAVNGAVSLLIAARLLYAQSLLSASQSDFSEHKKTSNPYMTALAICVESSALIVVAGVAAIVDQDFTVVLPQVSVLAPLLIIYRVAQGRSEAAVAKLEETLVFHHTQASLGVSS